MAVATSKVRLINPLRRPSVSRRPALRATASSAAPRAYLPGSPGPLQLHSSGEIPGTARQCRDLPRPGFATVLVPPPAHAPSSSPGSSTRSSVRRRRRFRFQAALSPKSTQAIK
ncbi:hypothetical protein NDU88_011072 [Pleurodeles waltl]|uniref:Uncharacterized protein n=1 Tax=Pleurodeles waltl TaxID=8319 RepID=A0AAV7Q0Q6_PLEWA|nr:hypothetical protein NDU88_011072 [Pleurodeles waltl]